MDTERAREFLLDLPHVQETQQWGDNLVYWVGDKAIGGKMFCLINLAADQLGAVSFATGPERFDELLERDGLRPAPYLARAHWVAADRWSALRHTEWKEHFRAAYDLVHAKLPKRTLELLALPARQREQAVQERKKLLAARAAVKTAKSRSAP